MTETVEQVPAVFDAAESEDGVAIPRAFVGGPGRDLRLWEGEEWMRQYGHFKSLVLGHCWHSWDRPWHPEEPREYCQATIICADLRCDCWIKFQGVRAEFEASGGCQCVGDLVYLGVCSWCDWEAPHFWSDENTAVEDSLDHAWPGWRDLPVLEKSPDDFGSGAAAKKKLAKWRDQLDALYPPGWVAQGGPIRTWREYGANRHVPNRSGFGGYDLGVLREGAKERWEADRARLKAEQQKRLTGKRGSTA